MAEKTRLEELKENRAARIAAATALADKLELDELELEDRLATKYGVRGVAFDIVVTSEGPIGLVLGDSVHFKRLDSGKKGGSEWQENLRIFVLAQLGAADDADRARVVDLLSRRPGVVDRCGAALIALHNGEIEELRGKA